MDAITIEARYCGPPTSAHGGYCCGRLAAFVEGPATVRLLSPPPLDTPMQVLREGDRVHLMHGDKRVGSAWPNKVNLLPPPMPAPDRVAEAATRFRGRLDHLYPGCFVCGTARADGLKIFAGPLDDGDVVASPWTPAASLSGEGNGVATEFLWAALDCPGAFTFAPPEKGTILLGELSANVEGSVRPGEAVTAIGWKISSKGRKHTTGTALYRASGECFAKAIGIWFEVA